MQSTLCRSNVDCKCHLSQHWTHSPQPTEVWMIIIYRLVGNQLKQIMFVFWLLFALSNYQINCMKARHRNWNQFPIPSPSLSLPLSLIISQFVFLSIHDPHDMRSQRNKLLNDDQWFTAVRAFSLSKLYLCEFFLILISFQFGFLWFFKCKRTWKFTEMNIKGHFLYLFVFWVFFSSSF